jgi:hypothetical protein
MILMNQKTTRRLIAAVAAVLTAACFGGKPRAPNEAAKVEVENRAFSDMTVYVVDIGGARRRIGSATGLTTTMLTIPQNAVGNGREILFVVDPIGSSRTSYTNRIYVTPGDQVRLVIPP